MNEITSPPPITEGQAFDAIHDARGHDPDVQMPASATPEQRDAALQSAQAHFGRARAAAIGEPDVALRGEAQPYVELKS